MLQAAHLDGMIIDHLAASRPVQVGPERILTQDAKLERNSTPRRTPPAASL